VFYDLCDEMGIMVWQDFPFGCGNYPAQIPEFRQSVQKEVTANVKRLRHHPSIVIYAGNNEDYSYMWGKPNRLGYDPKDTNPENWLKTQFPARYIYEKLLPDTVAELSPNTVYHRGSPYGSPERPDGNVLTIGDCHQWNVWHGTQEPYQNFDKLSARFVSEFGMESFPSMQTIKSYLSHEDPELSAFSSTVEFHNKAAGAERRIALYLAENFRFEHNPLDAYIYSTQLMQSDALSTAYRLWRRNWKGEGREYNSGALVWQINDCWPVTSWAIVDYHFRPKIAYHSIRRELAPMTIGAKRVAVKIPRDRRTAAHVEIEQRLEVWVSSFLLEGSGEGWKVVARTFEVASGRLVETVVVREGFVVEANRTVEVAEVKLPGWDGKLDSHLGIAVAVYLLDPQGRHRGRFVSWPEPVKYVPCKKDPGVRIVGEVGGLVQAGEEVEVGKEKKGALLKKVSVWVETPVKGFVLESRDGTVLDQGVDLVPGEVVEIGVRDLRVGDSVWGRWYAGEVGREFKLVWWEGEGEVEGLRVVEV
jgi:beta-mannosidase